MRYLCLIHLNEAQLAAMPPVEMDALNGAHLTLNRSLQGSGQLIEAEALDASAMTRRVQVREGRTRVLDGPYAESKEVVAGFYLIEAATMDEAL
ncbi:MAG TPA: YciI family protein, partial [Gemmatimonadaceae bacterium]|nr:YciI family protein [Gemmatimonadaceae bacterium]